MLIIFQYSSSFLHECKESVVMYDKFEHKDNQ
jgi:hypothetical protein